jgi:hypothetical protein
MLRKLLTVVARHDHTLAARIFQLQDSIAMKRLTLKRTKVFKGDTARLEIAYEVLNAFGTVSPFVGEIITEDHAKDLCDQTGDWAIKFV